MIKRFYEPPVSTEEDDASVAAVVGLIGAKLLSARIFYIERQQYAGDNRR